MSGIDAEWRLGKTRVPALECSALNSLGMVHAFAVRQPGIDVACDRAEALERLEPSHRALRESLGFGSRAFCTAEQVHGDRVSVATGAGPHFYAQADGLVTNDPEVCLGIYTADCCAVFLVDPVAKVAGLVHSGAKGTRLGITGVALDVMQKTFSCIASNVLAVLSPCIRPPRYEVDFAQAIRRQCEQAGVGRVLDSGSCTGSDLGRYYSYRMEHGKTGRLLALLGLPRT